MLISILHGIIGSDLYKIKYTRILPGGIKKVGTKWGGIMQGSK